MSSAREAAPLRARVSWVLFDWSAQPFYTLVVTFLFAPYFANVVAGDGGVGAATATGLQSACGEQHQAWGQALWGYGAAAAGILVALGSPLLGALADGRGRRKPWIALFALLLAASLSSLWLAVPSADMQTIAIVLAAFVIATASAEFATVFTNAMMPTLVPQEQLGRLSGVGWATGYAGGLVSLAIMAGLIVANPDTGKTVFGFDPLLKLDAATREGDRLVGPFAAAWFLFFMIPFFLFVPDIRASRSADAPKRRATAELWDTIRGLPKDRDMMLFLVARMIYSDGLSAIFAFGGIYGAAVFGWGAQELGIFGIVLSVTGLLGAIIGGVLDDRIGSKTVIITALMLLIVGSVGILSVDKSNVFFTTPVTPKAAGSSPFSSHGEMVFLAFAMLVGLVAAPVQAASRTLLARLAPPEKVTQYFGLFAFSGKVTAFLAPFAVATVTAMTCSQRWGMATILIFLIAGILLMLPVRQRRA